MPQASARCTRTKTVALVELRRSQTPRQALHLRYAHRLLPPIGSSCSERCCERYADWLPPEGIRVSPLVRPEQKIAEMQLADVVLAPSRFVERSILNHVDKPVRLAPYGVDLQQWYAAEPELRPARGPLRFLFAGHISVRKGLPLLLEAWRRAGTCRRPARTRRHLAAFRALAGRSCRPASAILGIARRKACARHTRRPTCSCFPPISKAMAWRCWRRWPAACRCWPATRAGRPDFVDADCGRIFPAGASTC